MKHSFKGHIKGILGSFLGLLLPTKRKRVERYATIPSHYEGKFGILEKLIRAGLFYTKRESPDKQKKMMKIHQNFWAQQLASEYYSNTHNRFQETFIPYFSKYLETLDEQLIEQKTDVIVEIGTGDGQLLNHLAKRWPSMQYIGIDLSTNQIEKNRHHYKHSEIKFIDGNAIDWIAIQEPQKTLYVTGLGVLEYFEYNSLINLFDLIRNKNSGNLLFLTEPVDESANLNVDFVSYTCGYECSFTHAYPKILERMGWTLIINETVESMGYKFSVIIALNEHR